MANTHNYKRVHDEVVPQIEVLQKAIELDPEHTIEYQRALDFCQMNIDITQTIIKATALVEKETKKAEIKETKNETNVAQTETEEKPKAKKQAKAKAKKEEAAPVEPVPAVKEPIEEQTDIFDMFGDQEALWLNG